MKPIHHAKQRGNKLCKECKNEPRNNDVMYDEELYRNAQAANLWEDIQGTIDNVTNAEIPKGVSKNYLSPIYKIDDAMIPIPSPYDPIIQNIKRTEEELVAELKRTNGKTSPERRGYLRSFSNQKDNTVGRMYVNGITDAILSVFSNQISEMYTYSITSPDDHIVETESIAGVRTIFRILIQRALSLSYGAVRNYVAIVNDVIPNEIPSPTRETLVNAICANVSNELCLLARAMSFNDGPDPVNAGDFSNIPRYGCGLGYVRKNITDIVGFEVTEEMFMFLQRCEFTVWVRDIIPIVDAMVKQMESTLRYLSDPVLEKFIRYREHEEGGFEYLEF